ncbi:hypothetical protein P8452_71022 [Trifolium repens]|nr:hypothetical protein P8452_39809 [Trifolium repens]WJX88994.1 hypothetical protein P8452_71022 [Trifolium repens]
MFMTCYRLCDFCYCNISYLTREEPKGKMQKQSSGMDLQSLGNELCCNPPKLRRSLGQRDRQITQLKFFFIYRDVAAFAPLLV